MTLEEAIRKLAIANVDDKNDWYSWRKINENKLPDGVALQKGNQYVKNVSLKKALNKKWKNSINQKEKTKIITYYISTWGGIHGNSEDKIEMYSRSEPDDLIALGSKGIASWSKALSVHSPNQYAIFDARVSASLNSLQIIHNTDNKELFPVLTSRNKTISDGINLIKIEANISKWENASEKLFYRKYLGYLEKTASIFDSNISVSVYTIEMLLFSKAEELVRQAFPQHSF